MRGLLEPEVLELLDASAHNRQQALDLVVANRLGTAVTDLAVGRFDAALVELRINSFGSQAEVRARCRACEEQLEAEVDLAELPLATEVPATLTVPIDGTDVSVHMPTVGDLRAAAAAPDPRRELLDRCVTHAGVVEAGSVDTGNDSGETGSTNKRLATIEAALEAADPMIDVSLAMQCPSCDVVTTTRFDIGTHLWSEIENYGRRLTLEVHWLASRYGWTESDVLALSPGRRRVYLELGSP